MVRFALKNKRPFNNLIALFALSALFTPWLLLHTTMYPMASVYVMSSAVPAVRCVEDALRFAGTLLLQGRSSVRASTRFSKYRLVEHFRECKHVPVRIEHISGQVSPITRL